MVPLLFVAPGEEMTISNIGGLPAVKQHLNEMGFTVGSKITVISKIESGIIVKVKEARVAIDKNMASKIMV